MIITNEPRGRYTRVLRQALRGLALCLAGTVAASPGAAAGEPDMNFTLTSPAFGAGEPIPTEYTCEGADVSPPIEWDGVPAGTKSLALIMDDPDAPDPEAPKMTWVHWVLYDIPPGADAIAEDADARGLPEGARDGTNSWQRTGYGGPCPPIGRHRYFHKLYALDVELRDLGKPTKDELMAAMEGHVVARTELVGTYEKKKR